MTTYERLKKLLAAVLPDADLSAVDENTALADIGVNSIVMLLLALSMEEEFGFKMDNIKPDDFKTVGDILAFIEANKSR